MKRHGEMGKHWVAVVQQHPAALCLWHTVPELGLEAVLVVSQLRSGLQVLQRDVNSVRAG